MGLFADRPNRLVIPRWRDFKETAQSRELRQEKNEHSPAQGYHSIEKLQSNWAEKKSPIHAIELVNSAFVAHKNELALEAAQYIVDNCKDANSFILNISKVVLGSNNDISPNPIIKQDSFENFNRKIACKIQTIRQRLERNPRNAFQWLDYARWNTIIGKFGAAEKCVKVALQLSPNNIFVLRSAVRFFVHIHKYDTDGRDSLSFALQLLRKNPITKTDPWLLATEISLCAYLEKTSNLMKAGFSMVEANRFSAFALSELKAALGTEEWRYGSNKSAKKLFESSLLDPNENVIAQADWATKELGEFSSNFSRENSYEASSYHNLYLENWEQSFDDALNWIIDQPFSSEPSTHASYLAGAIMDDNALAVEICNFGLRSNPKDFTLLNNKAYSLALENNQEEANAVFGCIAVSSLNEKDKVTYTATKGLMQYSTGHLHEGNLLYDEAENMAKKLRDDKTAFLVKLFKGIAILSFDKERVNEYELVSRLMQDFENFKSPEVKKVFDNLTKKVTKKAMMGKPGEATSYFS